MKPKLLDLFCCAGGAGTGYHQAGFEVVGVDINPQPHYPFAFIQADATRLDQRFLRFFDAIHASPPCQSFTLAQRIQKREHPDLVQTTRQMLAASGLPYVIENVEGAPLIDPVMLCGAMFFELRVYRHRLFETNWALEAPPHPEHVAPQCMMGRPPKPGEFIHVVGNFSGADVARAAMGIDWMSRDELSEAIPPAYTNYIGARLMAEVEARRLAEAA
ncbi:MAG TPA: DNA cytosine methyltransferase [Caulobacteraceae bacterium]|nr:DNA cytosine methyltransferase [Caulobacteraceae bacterium]